MKEIKLKEILVKIKSNSDIIANQEVQKFLNTAIEQIDQKMELQKVIHNLKQNINIYSVAHGFKLPETLAKLQLFLAENPNKWTTAGITGALTDL